MISCFGNPSLAEWDSRNEEFLRLEYILTSPPRQFLSTLAKRIALFAINFYRPKSVVSFAGPANRPPFPEGTRRDKQSVNSCVVVHEGRQTVRTSNVNIRHH